MRLAKSEVILAIDPGPKYSGVVAFDGEGVLYSDSACDNYSLLEILAERRVMGVEFSHVPIEGIASYGMAVGETVFSTAIWIGRVIQAFGEVDTTLVYRKDVKLFLCNSMRAKDTNIRQRILDIFPPTGGGKTPQIGTKKLQGPLYKVAGHSWSALAVALTFKYGGTHES